MTDDGAAASLRRGAPGTGAEARARTGTPAPASADRAPVALVRRLARPSPSASDRAVAAALARRADPGAVFEAAAALGVAPLVARHVDTDAFPDALRSRAAAVRRGTAARNLHLATALHGVVDRFEAAGVRALAYKGPVLAARAYGDVSGRAYSDLDVFVRRADLPAAAAALSGLGFVLVPEDPPSLPPADVAAGGHVVRPPAEFRFRRDDGVVVELRWRLGSRVRPLPLAFANCWERRTTVDVLGRPVPTFAPEDLLVVLARHGAKHHWNRLGWAVDVAALLDRVPLDWDAVESRAAALGARRVLLTCLLLAADVADAPVPPALLDAARADPAVRSVVAGAVRAYEDDPLTAALGTDGRRERAVDARLCDSRRARLALRARLAFEPQPVDAAAVPLPRSLHRLYHLVRPARLAWNAVGRRVRVPGRRRDRSETR